MVSGGFSFSLASMELTAEARTRLCDILILEHYLHSNIKLRLASCNESALQEAHDYATIIAKLISCLNARFEDKIPYDPVTEARKDFAKFIGLALFKAGRECLMTLGPQCSVRSACCDGHRLDGLKEAHEMFTDILKPLNMKIRPKEGTESASDAFLTTVHAVYADLKNQVVVGDLAQAARSGKISLGHLLEDSMERYFGSVADVDYIRTKLQARAVQLRALLEQTNPEDLATVLESKFPQDLFESNLRNFLRTVYSSFPECVLHSILHKEQTEIRDRIERTPEKTESKSTPTPVSKSAAAMRVAAKTAAPAVDYPFKGVNISGRFFRGTLEPVDERFAEIIEGRDVSVKNYLELRRRQAAGASVRKAPNAKKADGNGVSSAARLLERHNSAERIIWESQDRYAQPEAREIVRITPQKKSSTAYTINSHSPEPSSRDADVVPKRVRGRKMFSHEETQNLIEGIGRFGRDWRRIQAFYNFQGRTNVDLKDKARNLEKLGLL